MTPALIGCVQFVSHHFLKKLADDLGVHSERPNRIPPHARRPHRRPGRVHDPKKHGIGKYVDAVYEVAVHRLHETLNSYGSYIFNTLSFVTFQDIGDDTSIHDTVQRFRTFSRCALNFR